MKIRFYSPFNRICGSELDIEIEESITLKDLIYMLSLRYSEFEKYASKEDDEALWAHMLIVKNGASITLNDYIDSNDKIDILPFAAGG